MGERKDTGKRVEVMEKGGEQEQEYDKKKIIEKEGKCTWKGERKGKGTVGENG